MRLKESYTRFSEQLKERYAKEYKEAFFAELNNVYVALTRPVWEMHVLIPERVGNSINPVPFLIPPELFKMGTPTAPKMDAHKVETPFMLPTTTYQPWIAYLQEEFLNESAAQTISRQQGEIMHFCLAQLGNLTGVNVDDAIAKAVSKAQSTFSQTHDWDAYRVQLAELVRRPEWQKFFYLSEGTEVFCEREITNRYGDTRRIDRLIVTSKEVWIVDFKTSRLDEQNHQKQMDEYTVLTQHLYPDYKVQGFLLYLDDKI